MLTRLAALALALTTSLTAASAGGFAKPPAHLAADMVSIARPTPSWNAVRAALGTRRLHNLASLHTYVTTGVYPHNTYRTGPLNVWRDADGHICAAATIIALDHHADLVDETGKTNVNIRLLDVTSGPLLDWMLTSGLTIEEIDRIQEPGFMPDRPSEQAYRREDAKLGRDYRATEAYLQKHVGEDLDEATTRLMARPDLARALVSPASALPDGGAGWE
ncbi:hypothetical protein BH11MYX1_BH11MYX1_35030 [soil metagenome]